MILIILGVIWYIIGVIGTVFWWTKDLDFELEICSITAAFIGGILGPFAVTFCILDYLFKNPIVIFKKRK